MAYLKLYFGGNMVYCQGIDISIWQDNDSTPQMMNFNKSKTAGANFTFIKSSQSTWLDGDYILNWQHAKQSGLPRGAYHFLDWTKPALDQANFFCGLLKNDPGEMYPVVDFECNTNAPLRNKATSELYIFCNTVEQKIGKPIIIYTSPGYWTSFWDNSYPSYFSSKNLWIANYYVNVPTIPKPWSKWLFWQYGLGKGQGLSFGAESLDIDLDWFNGDVADLNSFFKLSQPLPIPVPTTNFFEVITLKLNIRTKPSLTNSDIVGALYLGNIFNKNGDIITAEGCEWVPTTLYVAKSQNGMQLVK
jgi:lysozyme